MNKLTDCFKCYKLITGKVVNSIQNNLTILLIHA